MEYPANMMTPTVSFIFLIARNRPLILLQLFTERVKQEFAGIPNVEIIVRDEGEFLESLTCMVLVTSSSGYVGSSILLPEFASRILLSSTAKSRFHAGAF
jgi:hypothetical protein